MRANALDLGLWARDAIAEALPAMILCREDCAGLCPTCGADLQPAPCDCAVRVQTDSRWDALRSLSDRLARMPSAGRPRAAPGPRTLSHRASGPLPFRESSDRW